ncbi:MAG: hypothetical protein HYR77_04580 [Ignavibacteria bacterium]|nr:hypothetical protein [Ignavibacteria bacterium]
MAEPRSISNKQRHTYMYPLRSGLFITLLTFGIALAVQAGERAFVQLKDFELTEVKEGGFILPSETELHIVARGGGIDKSVKFSGTGMFAYGWIINADTRNPVWTMDMYNTHRDKDDRKFDDWVTLPAGSYEVYFSAHAFASTSPFAAYNINIDRRHDLRKENGGRKKGLFWWLGDLFDGDLDKDWRRRSKNWGIEISVDDRTSRIQTFNPPKEFVHVVFKATRLGENEHIHQGITVSKPTRIRIYAIGEIVSEEQPADYGWIVENKSRRRIWEMEREQLRNAGGAEKNTMFDGTVNFPPGEYTLYFNTDDTHSFVDWNAAPPADPFNYGITLMVPDEGEQRNVTLSTPKEDQNIIVQLTHVKNNETRTTSFTLKDDARLRIYALGERGNSRRQMADYGWIVNAKTREKIWTMDVDRTEHGGGAEKNRMVDEVITLPKGTYTVFYQTDDSHAYDDWNAAPPFDPEHWGITISGEGENFNPNLIEKNVTPRESGVICQIIRVGDHANRSETFRLSAPTRVRVYAIGEGQDREMYDYGSIERASNGTVVWQMTYSMTFHAGGARKNRMVNTTILLDKGEYKLHYVSDDSHSFGDWNSDPPDDPTMWGITLYEEK